MSIDALRAALAHHEALALARDAHLADLRTEVRRLHERMAQLTRLLAPPITDEESRACVD